MERLFRAAFVGTALAATIAGGGIHAQQPNPAGLRLLRSRASLLGIHEWYQQTHRGVDVLDGLTSRHIYETGDIVSHDRRRALGRDVDVVPTISAPVAAAAAGSGAIRATLAIQAGSEPRLVWAVITEPPTGTVRTLVDARTGQVISSERIARDADGVGRVFNPNPVTTLRDFSLTDQDDADYPALGPAYFVLPLTRLDGSGFLRGQFASIGFDDAETAFSPAHTFVYDRSSTLFSQTMAYYHVTAAQEYIQSLGFTELNNQPQLLLPDVFPIDNSFYSPATDTLYLGMGGVDDSEDADVILHEYGHAMLDDQVPLFGQSIDAAAIGEGFSDYWAVTISEPASGGFEVPCVGEWDSAALGGGCLRRVDSDLTVTDRIFDPHYDGMIWSRALWEIHQKLGREAAHTIVLEAQFAYPPDTSFDTAARITVETARRLFGTAAGRAVQDAFVGRGLIVPMSVKARSAHPPQGPPGFREIARLGTPAPGGGYYALDFEPYELRNDGVALYGANVTTGGEALFLGSRFDETELIRSGNPAPGGGVLGLGVLPSAAVDARGEAAVTFVLEPFLTPSGRNAGVYRSWRQIVRAVVAPGVTPAPTGGLFVGSPGLTSINEQGKIAFAGMIETTAGISGTFGIGVFLTALDGRIETVAAPGMPAPGGGTFDYAAEPALSKLGDIAFTGHVAGTPCLTSVPQTQVIGCVRDLFVRRAGQNAVQRLAAVGQPAPGGGVFRNIREPVINGRGDILFRAVVTTDDRTETGYFLSRGGGIVSIARTGDRMPGGGNFVATSAQPGNWDLNERGEVAFSARLDTFDSLFGEFGIPDQGLYRWSEGIRSLVVRSGSPTTGGEIVLLGPLSYAFQGVALPFSGAQINDGGQVLFHASVLRDNGFIDEVLYVRE